MNTAPAARRTHLLFLAVDADTRREMRFADHAEGVEVYSFDGLDAGVESTRIVSREEGRALWTAALAEGYVWTRSMVAFPPAPPAPVAVVAPVAPPAPAKPAAPSFESETCSRCLGSGKFSRCQMYGDTCFKCAGAGRVLTRRGLAAAAYLTTLRSRPVSALMAGDVVRLRTMGGSVWTTVEQIEPCADPCRSIVDGVESAPREGLLTIRSAAITMIAMEPDALVRVRQTREQSAATWDAALAYQATLTKAGTPRKVAKRADAATGAA